MSWWDAVRNITREQAAKARQRRVTRANVRAAAPAAPPAPAPAPAAPPRPVTLRPWGPLAPAAGAPAARCTICTWEGDAFEGVTHCESAICPGCGSIGRDRFLLHCFTARTPYRADLRVLETSPRMGEPYRLAMAARLDYLTSDFDNKAHKASMQLDLQAIDLPDAALDVIVTPHVLEHVPDTDAALREIFRVLRPGGRMYLQVPLGQAETAPPPEPEFHADNTPVFWRFGLDLTERLRANGFATTLLVTEDFRRRVEQRDASWPEGVYPEWDAAALVEAAKLDDLTVVADDTLARAAWLHPSYMYVTWEAIKPAA